MYQVHTAMLEPREQERIGWFVLEHAVVEPDGPAPDGRAEIIQLPRIDKAEVRLGLAAIPRHADI